MSKTTLTYQTFSAGTLQLFQLLSLVGSIYTLQSTWDSNEVTNENADELPLILYAMAREKIQRLKFTKRIAPHDLSEGEIIIFEIKERAPTNED